MKSTWIKRKRSRILLSAILVVFVALFLYHYRVTLYWNCSWKYNRMGRDIREVVVTPMPQVSVPDDWVRHVKGGFEFYLPGEFKVTRDNESLTAISVYQNGLQVVYFDGWDDPEALVRILDREFITPELEALSFPRLHIAAYGADATRFDWTMSQNEMKERYYFLSNDGLLRPRNDIDLVESRLEPELESLLQSNQKRSQAIFDWQSGGVGGALLFVDREKPLDLDRIRSVCRSFHRVETPE